MVTLLNCIERIPSLLLDIQENRDVRFAKLQELNQEKAFKKIVFVASGSSYNAAFTAKFFLEEVCGLQVELLYPNIFQKYYPFMDKDALHVFISQGGSTRLVYESCLKAKQAGCTCLSITAELDCPIAKVAHLSIEMGCRKEEYLYRTIGFSTTVATCWMLGTVLSDQKFDEDYQKMVAHLPILKEITLAWYQQHRFSLMKRNQAMFTGTHDLWPIAQEADIKMMEMVPMMTKSYELEEFIHGPQNAFEDSTAFYILVKADEDNEKAEAIAKFLKQEIGFCTLVGNVALDDNDLTFEAESRYFSALEYITIFQVLAYKLADDHGRDLSRGVNAQIKNYITKTI